MNTNKLERLIHQERRTLLTTHSLLWVCAKGSPFVLALLGGWVGARWGFVWIQFWGRQVVLCLNRRSKRRERESHRTFSTPSYSSFHWLVENSLASFCVKKVDFADGSRVRMIWFPLPSMHIQGVPFFHNTNLTLFTNGPVSIKAMLDICMFAEVETHTVTTPHSWVETDVATQNANSTSLPPCGIV